MYVTNVMSYVMRWDSDLGSAEYYANLHPANVQRSLAPALPTTLTFYNVNKTAHPLDQIKQ